MQSELENYLEKGVFVKRQRATSADRLLAAGLIPIPWFLFWLALAGLTAPGYSAVAGQASELSLLPGRPAILFDVAEWGTGLAYIAFALGLWKRSGRRIAWGALCWIVFGWSMITNGIWPMGDARHGFYAVGLVNLIAPALSLAEDRGLANDRTVYRATILTSTAGLLYLWLNVTGRVPAGATGILQRVFFILNALWPFVVARVGGSGRQAGYEDI